MKFWLKNIVIALAILVSSCSFRNQKSVSITIDSNPVGAKIFIDGVYYRDTARVVDLIPDKNYHLKLVKDGYQDVEYEMKTQFSFRSNRQEESTHCHFDLLTSILILPFFSLRSVYCRDFTKELYSFDLVSIPKPSPQNQPLPNSVQMITPNSSPKYRIVDDWPENLDPKKVKNSKSTHILENGEENRSSKSFFVDDSAFPQNANRSVLKNKNSRKNKIW